MKKPRLVGPATECRARLIDRALITGMMAVDMSTTANGWTNSLFKSKDDIIQFLPLDAMHKCDLCRRPVSVCPCVTFV